METDCVLYEVGAEVQIVITFYTCLNVRFSYKSQEGVVQRVQGNTAFIQQTTALKKGSVMASFPPAHLEGGPGFIPSQSM